MKRPLIIFSLLFVLWLPQISARDFFDFYTSQNTELSPRDLYNIGLEFEEKNDFGNALLSYLTLIEKTRHQKNNSSLRIYALAKTRAAIIYFSHGNFTQASDLFHRSLDIFVDMGDMDGEANLLNNLGTVYYKWGDYDMALQYFFRAMHISDSLNLTNSLLLTYNNIGAVYLAKGDYKKGLELFEKSLVIYKEKGDSSVFHLLSNIGVVHQHFNNDSLALEYYVHAHSIAKALNTPQHETISLINIAEIYYRSEQYDNALELFYEGKNIAIANGYRSLLRSIYLSMSKTYDANGETPKALDYYKKFLNENELLFNAEKHQALREIQFLYEVEKKNREFIILEKEIENQLARIRLQNSTLIFFGFLIAIIMLAISLFFIQKKKQKLSHAHLVNQNAEIVDNEINNLRRLNKLGKRLLKYRTLEEKLVLETQQFVEYFNGIQQKVLPYSLCNLPIFDNIGKQFNELTTDESLSFSEPPPTMNLRSPHTPTESPLLNEYSKKKIANAILKTMEEVKPYLQEDFSLDKLTHLVGSNKKYVSFVLNDWFGKSFNLFVNEYRINHACKMLTDNHCQHFTIEAVSSFVGFKSKTSFNQAFKSITGKTPSHHKRTFRPAGPIH